jgi:2-polyprenyl-3-methyl-5-hydroxy-6-metoxy-1,4-benzoquinol methylase
MAVVFLQRDVCPLCAATEFRLLCEIPFRDQQLAGFIEEFYRGRLRPGLLTEASYRIVSCRQCEFIFQDSILDGDGMQLLYRDWIDQELSLQKKQAKKEKLLRQYAGQVQSLARLIPKPPEQVRLLDFGMGWGYWSRVAQAQGFDVYGFELSTRRVEYAREMGIRVIESLAAAEVEFDYVHASQVFEHLPDPLQSLREICSYLKPRGIIYIRVPDGRRIARELTKTGWSSELGAIHPLEHINCFTRKTLIGLAAQAGLKPIDPPLRLNLDSLWGGIKREFADRFVTTHLYFGR